MQEYDLPISAEDAPTAASSIAAACFAAGLRITLYGTLAAYPGCVHWHLKRDGQRGTLELILWPAGPRLWFKIAAGRAAAWMPATVAALTSAIAVALNANREP